MNISITAYDFHNFFKLLVSLVGPVSYTHLDVYKRQVYLQRFFFKQV